MKYFIILLMCISMVSIVSSQGQQTLGAFPQNSPINLTQLCANCTYVTLTFIKVGTGALYNFNTNFTKLGSSYNYTLDPIYTSTLGEYIINGIADPDGIETIWNYNLFVTPSGTIFDNSMSIPIFLPLIFMTIITVCFFFGMMFVKRPEYKITLFVLSFFFLFMTVGFGIVAARDIFWGFPQIYNFINIFYRIFIIGSTVAALFAVLATSFFVIKRVFSRKGFVIENKTEYVDGR